MTAVRHAVLVVGSPRGERSASVSLGRGLMKRLTAAGVSCEQTMIGQSDSRQVLAAIRRSDLVILSFPLYFDCQPAPVIGLMQDIAAGDLGGRALSVIVNCGFPEAEQAHVSLRICERFAREAGLSWRGGLAMGAGTGLGGHHVEDLGGRTRHAVRALDQAAVALARGESIPISARSLMAQQTGPRSMYLLFGNLMWLFAACRNRVLTRLWARPYR